MVMVFVPDGEFIMGTSSEITDMWVQEDEKPQHTVYLDAFWIYQTEVTNAMYEECVADGVCEEPLIKESSTRSEYYGIAQHAEYPVIHTTWENAKTYCEWVGHRLPTEAEWEKAARGIDGRTYPWGEDLNCELANIRGCVYDTTQVGIYLEGASQYSALDMAGNAYEWVADWYDENYYDRSPYMNPPGPSTGFYRVQRGGDFNSHKFGIGIRTSSRSFFNPDNPLLNSGFRCAVSH
jgi:formylglycine-generating enzyme required for sulfatase activity